MKFFTATLGTESNSYAAAPTGYAAFASFGIHHGDGSRVAGDGLGMLMRTLNEQAAADGHAVVESLCTFAQPSGPTVRRVYEAFRDEILNDLRAAMPVDAVVLFMHGAMIADGYDDCEGDLLAAVRQIVGPLVPIGCELDLHCHFTEQMRLSADVIVAYKEYPHIDGADRAKELYRLVRDTAEGRIRPVTAVFDCRMVGLWHTTREPMKSFVQRMQSFEGRNGVLSVSLGHGFAWGDVADNGCRLWVVTDNDPALAAKLAEQLGREFWDLREQTRAPHVGVDEAIDRLPPPGLPRPVVWADVADNAGGGAPADSTFILSGLLERGIGCFMMGPFWDLGAVAICREAGEGSTIDLRLGGKCGPSSGQPVDLRGVRVRAIKDDHDQDVFGMRWTMGASVWVEAPGGIHLLITSVRSQIYGTDAFTGLGMPLEGLRLIVVKSTQHFHAAFAQLAHEVVYVSTPGAISQDFTRIPFRKRSLNYWPRVADPWKEAAQ